MPTPQKESLVAELREAVQNSAGIYLAEFRGLNVGEMSELRGRIIAAEGRLRVAKNRLLKLAFAGTPAEGLIEYLTGPTAVAFCRTDPMAVAKVLSAFGKDHEYVAIKAGLLDGQVWDGEQMARIAALPPRNVLLAQVLAGISAPLSGLVNLLGQVTGQFVFTLAAIADQRQTAAQ